MKTNTTQPWKTILIAECAAPWRCRDTRLRWLIAEWFLRARGGAPFRFVPTIPTPAVTPSFWCGRYPPGFRDAGGFPSQGVDGEVRWRHQSGLRWIQTA